MNNVKKFARYERSHLYGKRFFVLNRKLWQPYSRQEVTRVSQMAIQGAQNCQDCRSDSQDNPRHLGVIACR